MTDDTPIHLNQDLAPDGLWLACADATRRWLAERALAPQDAVLLLPFVELLPPARSAFAGLGGWMPRIETVRTLAATLGPAPGAAQGSLSGEVAVDRLVAAQLLAQVAALRDWRARDPQAHAQAVGEVLQAAQTLARGAAAVHPAQREAWWALARQSVAGPDSAAPLDGLLAQVALAWAALTPAPATDRLFSLTPSAWIVLEAGGADALTCAVLADATQRGIPVLRLVADASDQANPFDAAPANPPRLLTAPDAEAEAMAAASVVALSVAQSVAQSVATHQMPVALIAEDRAGVRRIRALLERLGLRIADESGWTLSTTRAGARVMALLRAAQAQGAQSGADAWLDWLKAEVRPGPECAGSIHLDRLELLWRREGPGALPQPNRQPEELAALAWWADQRSRLNSLNATRRQPLAAWLQVLRATLPADEPLEASLWRQDSAGRAVWQALRLDVASARADVDGWTMTLDDLTDWVDATLADAEFRPADASAQVVITPMARAMLRPFGAVIFPGADERHLGPPAPGPALLSDATLRALGLDDARARGERLARCFVQLLRQSGLTLLRRSADGDEHLGPSPWLTRLRLARRRRGLPDLAETAAQPLLTELPAAPVYPPLARAGARLPQAVSASAVEALRACPYRFFSRSVLRLGQTDELEADTAKRDYGSLLHAMLERFHAQRDLSQPLAVQQQTLVALGSALLQEHGLDAASMLPFLAGLPTFAERYLVWQAQRDAEGWVYAAGEIDSEVTPEGLGGLHLRGRIDRLDRLDRGGQGQQQVLDYKTGAAEGLKKKLRQPLEDTQLAFYAAQLMAGPAPPDTLQAAYVALDERTGITELPHPDVTESARALLSSLAADWPRLAAGAPLRALGEGAACDFCEARGLCRRDHWVGDPLDDVNGLDGLDALDATGADADAGA